MKASDVLTDAEARRRIRHDTASTLFVDAGAGSGKTQALVSRVQQLVVEDGVPIEQVAAVTFTERAAAELRDRLRDRFEQAARHTSRPEARERAEAALDGLDLAAIGTLHSFAQRILSEHPIEAGIPPLLGVLDEVGSSVAFEARWAQLRTQLLDDEEMALTLELAFAVGITLDHLRSIIVRLNADWDLVRSHVLAAPAPEPLTAPDVAGILAEARRLVAEGDHCTDPEDRFLANLAALEAWVGDLEAADHDPRATVAVLRQAERLKWSYGRSASWGGRLDGLRSDCKKWAAEVTEVVAAVSDQALRAVVRWCGERVLESAEQRRAAGELEFHDLLVLARDVLRDERRGPRPRSRAATPGCSSTSSRTPTRSRSRSPCASPAARRPAPSAGRTARCRPGRSSSSATRSSRSTGSGGPTSGCTCAPGRCSAATSR